jgi:hypothetical protein
MTDYYSNNNDPYGNYTNPYGQSKPSDQQSYSNPHPQQQQQNPYGGGQSYQSNASNPYGSQPNSAPGSLGSQPIWNTNMVSMAAAAASSNPDAMFSMAQKATHTFLDQGTARMIPGLERLMSTLRLYFAVDNNYVKKKMMRVLFSPFYKHWARMTNPEYNPHTQYNTGHKFALPIQDVNALDLYLPVMSLITYVLLCALCYGTSGEFNPEVLSDVGTRCLVITIIEVLLFRAGFYMMQAPVDFLDLFAVTGYKYLGLTMNMIVGYSLSLALVSGGHRGYYAMFLWTASATSYFMLKWMANNIPDVVSSSGPKREVVVLAFAASQVAIMWFLGQTKFLN